MNIFEIIQTTLEPTFLKIYMSIALMFLFLVGDLHTQGVIAVFMLLIIDTILGTMGAYRSYLINENQDAKYSFFVFNWLYHFHRSILLGYITSRKFGRLVQKGAVYFMAISAGYFTDVTVGVPFIQATMIAFIGTTEFISILENMGKLGYETPPTLLSKLKLYKQKQ